MHVLKQSDERSIFIDQKIPRLSIAEKQKTLSNPISFKGVGLHTGNKVSMTLHPAPVNTQLCTLLSDNTGVHKISTVEHILSALHGLEIDNVYIDLDSNEVPVCDGSSLVFVNLLKKKRSSTSKPFQKFYKNKKYS